MNRARLIEKLEKDARYHARPGGQGVLDHFRLHTAKRIRSIIRRLKRCNQCLRGKVPELEERGGPWMEYQVLVWENCPRCNGTGMAI